MTTVDHRTEAETNLTVAAGETPGTPEERYYLAAAQVHATLYAAEQQRLANIIAVTNAGLDLAVSFDDVRMGLAGEVWEGLGLS